MVIDLIIFDCDGVLVDSEAIALDLLGRTLAANGLDLSTETVSEAFQGRTLPGVRAVLAERFGHPIEAERLERMQDDLLDAFTERLRPVEGMPPLVDAVRVGRCVASSSAPRRLHHSLATTGLADRFGTGVFSADAVAHGKPAPDLFLHAAARMGVEPERCLVIEDSPAGIRAARAAGMAVIGFTGGGHARGDAYRVRLRAEGASTIARDAAELSRHLAPLLR